MANVQQPEQRRSEQTSTVQESRGPRPGDPVNTRGGRGRPVPPGQVSPYGPSRRPVAEPRDGEDRG
ncbi:MAG TPA: hypothetical protein VFX60_20030 [Micromonospora sp.]|nr:hypothetical protein [Micromonospora sp.]